MKRRQYPKSKRKVRMFVCAQCGESGPYWRFRPCRYCGVMVHHICVVHHAVDHEGDELHPRRDFSRLMTPAA